MQDKTAILESGGIYHIYNRANGSELLFLSDDNYRYFLDKFFHYIHPVADVFCYCLMPNHFHFLVRIKPKEELEIFFRATFPKFQTLEKLPSDKLLSKQFSNLFSSYTQALNKQQNRKGSLFMKNFKRKRIDSETYLRKVIHYIHYNPLEAGLAERPEDWKYSSYKAIITPIAKTAVLKDEVISYFDDLSNFIYCHSYPPDETGIDFR